MRIVDAILGALADGDIGAHFPPNDPRWKGASSDQFLAFAVERVEQRGGKIAHIDVTVVCEAPRIGPHRDAMRKRIAEIAGISVDRVASRRPPARSSASPAAGRASPRWRPPRCAPALVATGDVRRRDHGRCERPARSLQGQEADGRDGGILHRRTGGRRADRDSGSSAVVDRGFVTYTNEAKQQMLGVPAETLETHSAR